MATPYRSTTDEHLGPIIRAFPFGATKTLLTLSAVLFGIGLIPIVNTATGNWKLGEGWTVGTYVGLVLFLGVVVGLPAYFVYRAIKYRRSAVNVHEHGLTYSNPRATFSVKWEDLESITSSITQQVRNGIPGPVCHRHTLGMVGGHSFALTHELRDIDLLIYEIETRSMSYRLARAFETLADGRCDFGPFAATQAGLQHGHDVTPWTEIDSASIANGQLVVQRVNRASIEVPLATIPNARVLEALVNSQRRGN